MAHTQADTFDQHDPHAFHEGEHHGHVIVSPVVLTSVLLALVFFTILTVFASRAEMWIAETFMVAIPQWVNVVVALSIAVVKSVLVCLFFMQLKYDNPLNSLIFLFCLFAVALFLGFSTLDLGTQGLVYPYEARPIQAGGTQLGVKPREGEVSRSSTPIVEWARQQWKADWARENGYVDAEGNPTPTGMARADDAWQEEYDHHHANGHGEVHAGSGPDQSRPRHGITPGLFDDHADSHGAEAGH